MDEIFKILLPYGEYFMNVEFFPYFFIADFIISSILVRDDSNHLGPKFRQKHPFTSWLCTIITALSGAFIASFFFGEPLLDILQQNNLILLLTAVWYAVNYSPFDIVYKVARLPVVIIPASCIQECVRLRFVYLGVLEAAQLYPKAPLIIMMGGIIKGNGYGMIKIVERLIRGLWNPKSNEFLELSYFSKSGVMASLVFLLHHYKILNYPVEILYLGVLVCFVIGRMILVLADVEDPMSPIEAPFCRLFFGSWEEPKVTNKPNSVEPKGYNHEGDGDANRNNNINNSNHKKKNGSGKKNNNKKKD